MAEERQRQIQRQTLERLGAVEAEIFDTLEGKRVFVEMESRPNYTGVLLRHGLDFVQLTDVIAYGQGDIKNILRYEIEKSKDSSLIHNLHLQGPYASRILSKRVIERMHAFEDC